MCFLGDVSAFPKRFQMPPTAGFKIRCISLAFVCFSLTLRFKILANVYKDALNKGDCCRGTWCSVIDEKCHIEGLQMDRLGLGNAVSQQWSALSCCRAAFPPLYRQCKRDRKLQEMKEARGRTATSRVNWSKAIRGWNVSEFSVLKLQLSLKLLDCCCRGPEKLFPVTRDASIQLFSSPDTNSSNSNSRVSASSNSIQMLCFFII